MVILPIARTSPSHLVTTSFYVPMTQRLSLQMELDGTRSEFNQIINILISSQCESRCSSLKWCSYVSVIALMFYICQKDVGECLDRIKMMFELPNTIFV
jgi:hypothetical protein